MTGRYRRDVSVSDVVDGAVASAAGHQRLDRFEHLVQLAARRLATNVDNSLLHRFLLFHPEEEEEEENKREREIVSGQTGRKKGPRPPLMSGARLVQQQEPLDTKSRIVCF